MGDKLDDGNDEIKGVEDAADGDEPEDMVSDGELMGKKRKKRQLELKQLGQRVFPAHVTTPFAGQRVPLTCIFR